MAGEGRQPTAETDGAGSNSMRKLACENGRIDDEYFASIEYSEIIKAPVARRLIGKLS